MQTKWNIGGCGTECGSSGVTTTCPCEEYCDAGTVRDVYSITNVGADLSVVYESGADGDGCCVFRSGHTVTGFCGGAGAHYAVMTLCGDAATVQIYQSSDDALVLQFGLVHTEAPTRDCSGFDSLGNAAYVWDGGAVISDCAYDVSAVRMVGSTEDVPCTDTPWEIAESSGNCCLCYSCTSHQDLFDRDAGTDVGDDWEEVAGDWEITAASRVRVDSADARLLSVTVAPQIGVLLDAVASSDDAGQKLRLILHYQDADDCVFAEWECGTEGYLRLYRRSGGTDTLIDEATPINSQAQRTYRWTLCTTEAGTEAVSRLILIDSAGHEDPQQVGGTIAAVTTPGRWGVGTGDEITDFAEFTRIGLLVVSDECVDCRVICRLCEVPVLEWIADVASDVHHAPGCPATIPTGPFPCDISAGAYTLQSGRVPVWVAHAISSARFFYPGTCGGEPVDACEWHYSDDACNTWIVMRMYRSHRTPPGAFYTIPTMVVVVHFLVASQHPTLPEIEEHICSWHAYRVQFDNPEEIAPGIYDENWLADCSAGWTLDRCDNWPYFTGQPVPPATIDVYPA